MITLPRRLAHLLLALALALSPLPLLAARLIPAEPEGGSGALRVPGTLVGEGRSGADLAARGGDSGIVRHILRLEGADAKPAIGEDAAQPRDQHRLADIRAGALQHQSSHAYPPAISHNSPQATT